MLVIPVKDSDSIEKALKKFKKKVEKTGMIRALRSRQAFEKPSVTRRQQIIKAKYRTQMLRENTL
jgi:small subunit ribosomal protein S21